MLPLPSTDQDLRCPGFCDCRFPSCVDVANHKGNIPDLVTCRCGEDSGNGLEWQWHHTENSDAQVIGRDIVFHPTYSQGTAIVRGEQPLQQDKVHFWEMRIITVLAGTDVVSSSAWATASKGIQIAREISATLKDNTAVTHLTQSACLSA